MSRSQIDRPSAVQPIGADDHDCPILHVDMDAFYASVSLIDRPELVGKPVIIGGSAHRGGAVRHVRGPGSRVHSAMPMGRAGASPPGAVVIEPDFRRYTEASAGVMSLFRR